jgi:DNA-binding GntR family transcriptional regulator
MKARMAPISTRINSAAAPVETAAEITGRSSAAEIAGRLRRRIATQAIAPGSRLREWDVAGEFAVPRLTAREALDTLAHQGFVERQPNRGVLVRRYELAEVLHLFEMREVNEGLCARLAAQRAGGKGWDDLIAHFGSPMEAFVAHHDLDNYVGGYDRFHGRLIATAGSPQLAELLIRLNDMTSIFGRRVLLVSDRTQHALADHRAVLAALRQGDTTAAEQARRRTIANVRAVVERYSAFVL